ncbi:unnamed protein product [Lampetra fluviatilis]
MARDAPKRPEPKPREAVAALKEETDKGPRLTCWSPRASMALNTNSAPTHVATPQDVAFFVQRRRPPIDGRDRDQETEPWVPGGRLRLLAAVPWPCVT